MIRKVLRIKGVTVFDDCQAKGDVEFGKVTLILGENARGKSTLTATLRSLREDLPVVIEERARLGSKGLPEIAILTDKGRVIFQNGAWSDTFPNLELFDAEFVQANVFRGDQVEHDHKRNLYRFVIGEQGVVLAQHVDELDVQIREVNQELAGLRTDIERQIRSRLTVEDFLRLPKDERADASIAQQQREVEAIKRASEIAAKPELAPLGLPEVPLDQIGALLWKGLDQLCADAAERTRAHIEACMDAHGEAWIRQGLEYVRDDSCPFCGRSLAGVALVEAYRRYFSEAYAELTREVDRTVAEVRRLLGESALMAAQQVALSNQSLAEFWRSIVSTDYPEVDWEHTKSRCLELRKGLEDVLENKASHPATRSEPRTVLEPLEGIVRELRGIIDDYNSKVRAANQEIAARKQSIGETDLAAAEAQLLRLIDSKNRHSAPLAETCEKLRLAQEKKAGLETNKNRAKRELDQYSRTLFPKYTEQMKGYLRRFGANFGIAKVKTGYQAGRPRMEYCIELRGQAIDLDAKSAGQPCFRNTLSSGDRSTLALAFFLARLAVDDDTAGKVVVFDDPITSLDRSRRFQTQREIRELSGRTAQVVVLSHDPYFLRGIWDNTCAADRKALKLVPYGDASEIAECDLIAETREQYFRDHGTLAEFRRRRTTDDPLNVARCIRPVLEGYLRVRYPEDCRHGEWLGDYERKIRGAEPGCELRGFQPYVDELGCVREYCQRFLHSDEGRGETGQPDLQELWTYVDRALRLISGTTQSLAQSA